MTMLFIKEQCRDFFYKESKISWHCPFNEQSSTKINISKKTNYLTFSARSPTPEGMKRGSRPSTMPISRPSTMPRENICARRTKVNVVFNSKPSCELCPKPSPMNFYPQGSQKNRCHEFLGPFFFWTLISHCEPVLSAIYLFHTFLVPVAQYCHPAIGGQAGCTRVCHPAIGGRAGCTWLVGQRSLSETVD